MFGITVSGGTNAGWRRLKFQQIADWVCSSCGARLRYFWTACPNCKNPRP